jgi:hypothetical protein
MTDGFQTQVDQPRSGKPSRAGKTMIGAYVDKDGAFTIQELLLKRSREQGERVTMQEAIVEALTDYCKKYGVTVSL